MNKALAAAHFAAVCAAFGVSGCSTDDARAARERNPAPCPNAVVLADAARLVVFEEGAEETIENVAWSAEVEDVSLQCRYYSDKPIDASVEIAFAFGRGPKADANARPFRYFVAVTRTDREVIAKETFTVDVKFGDRDAVERVEEKIGDIVIPRRGETTSGVNFEIVVGLVMTREQAIFNRTRKSLKFPTL